MKKEHKRNSPLFDLYEDEIIVSVIRRHWLAFLGNFIIVVIFLILFIVGVAMLGGSVAENRQRMGGDIQYDVENAISNNIKFPPYERLEGQVRLACEGRDLNHRGTIKGIFKHLNEKHEQALELGEIQEDDPAFKILDDEDYFRKFLEKLRKEILILIIIDIYG